MEEDRTHQIVGMKRNAKKGGKAGSGWSGGSEYQLCKDWEMKLIIVLF
jgi:hypothetical protein